MYPGRRVMDQGSRNSCQCDITTQRACGRVPPNACVLVKLDACALLQLLIIIIKKPQAISRPGLEVKLLPVMTVNVFLAVVFVGNIRFVL